MPHIHDLIDFTVEVFIVKDNKVLLRKHDKYKKWLGVGGHVELNEDPNEAVVREVKEEVGMNITLANNGNLFNFGDGDKHLIAPFFMNRHKINDNHEHIALVYFAKAESYNIVQGEKEISEECRWFNMQELTDLNEGIIPSVKNYAVSALNYYNNLVE